MGSQGMQPRAGQTLKGPERRDPEHELINADAADLCTVHSDFMKELFSHTVRTFSCRAHGICRHYGMS